MLDPSIKAVLFDFDGTFADTAPDLINTANYIYRKYNKKIISYLEGRQIASDGIKAFLDKRFDESKDNYKNLFKEFYSFYHDHLNENFSTFDGIESLLSYLNKSSIRWGIVTNKSRVLTEKLLKLNNFQEQCEILVCGDDGLKPKPDPDLLLHALNLLNLSNKEVLYLGDGYRDIIAAKKANIKCVLVTYGYLKSDDNYMKWEADLIINHPDQLYK